MNIKEEARRAISRSSLSINAIAKAAVLSPHTVKGIADGSGNPTWDTLDAVLTAITNQPSMAAKHTCRNCRFFAGMDDDATVCGLAQRFRNPSGCAAWEAKR